GLRPYFRTEPPKVIRQAHDSTEAARLSTEHWNLSRGQIEMFVMPAGLEGQIALPVANEG
ncbi:MAG: hypothetical protein OXC60_09975, partial [Litoreibacter sp.]|nr:hypothetical protein [Litoreibacter sp.]